VAPDERGGYKAVQNWTVFARSDELAGWGDSPDDGPSYETGVVLVIKREELTNLNSCMNRALDDEMTFVLLGRDPAAPVAIRAWAQERIRLGKNTSRDLQITDALETAAKMRDIRNDPQPPRVHCHICNQDFASIADSQLHDRENLRKHQTILAGKTRGKNK
jgi:hypothetical protein